MTRRHEHVFALNAGGVDKEALGRIDLEKMRLAGQHPVANWLPQVIGPMSVRPGLESLVSLSSVTRPIPFIRDSDTTALLAFSDQEVAIYDEDGAAIAVNAVSTAITNPTFTSGGGGWTDVSETGDGTDGTATFGGSGTASLVATRWRAASTEQSVSVAGGDQTVSHTLRIVVSRGPVFFRVGSTSGGEEVFGETRLDTGTHKLTFTPGSGVGTIYIRFRSDERVVRLVESCQFEDDALGGAGSLTLPTPYLEADLPFISYVTSYDTMFVGDGTYQQRRIERRGASSWSIVLYQTRNGPFRAPEGDKITLTPSAYTGNGALTSNTPYFKSNHVGTLFELTHPEQHVIDELVASDQVTDKITIRGLHSPTKAYDDRNFGYTIDFTTGSFVGTIALESSTDSNAEIWTQTESHLSSDGDVSITYNDEQSNILRHYRFRVTAYTSGYADVTLTQLAGSQTGQVRITDYSSTTSVNYETVVNLGGTTATRDWRGPQWSSDLGWPRVPSFRDDRLHWFRADRDFASIVDDFDNFDDSAEGDSGPIDRSVGAESVRWALDTDKFIVGTSGFAASIQASDLGEIVTPTSYTVRKGPTLGAAFVPPVLVDDVAIMTDRSKTRLYDLFVPNGGGKLKSTDMSRLNPRAVRAKVKAMAVQRKPDTRVYIVLEDGTCVVVTYEREDNVIAITTLETDGTFDDVMVLPSAEQDYIYFIVTRNGGRYLERMGIEQDQESVSSCALLDGYKVLTGSISSITGASHLNGKTVSVWADGQRRADVAISGGTAELGATYSRVVYGLSYDAEFTSVKLAYGGQLGTAVGQTKIVRGAGLILSNSCLDGIVIGPDSTNTGPMEPYVDGALRTTNQFFSEYDEDIFPIYSDWNADSRVYVATNSAEGPVTIQSIVLDIETRDGFTSDERGGARPG